MTVTEAERHRLYESLKSSLGAAEADTLMNLMPSNDLSEFATRRDVEHLRSDMAAEFAHVRAEMRTEFADVRAEMRAEFADVRAEMRTGFAEVRAEFAEVRSELATLRADLKDDLVGIQRTFGTWLFASQAAVIAAVAMIVGLLR
jgi:ribosomal protein L29